MTHANIKEKILENLNNYLFKAFIAISNFYPTNKADLKKLFISLKVVKNIDHIIETLLIKKKDELMPYRDEELINIKSFTSTIVNIAALTHKDIKKIKELHIFKSHTLTQEHINMIAMHTKIGIETLIYELNNN